MYASHFVLLLMLVQGTIFYLHPFQIKSLKDVLFNGMSHLIAMQQRSNEFFFIDLLPPV
jgi:hypothetical protein